MTFDEFLDRVKSEPPRTRRHEVRVNSMVLIDRIRKRTGRSEVLLSELQNEPGARVEWRETVFGHVLGAPASRQTIDAWQAAHLASSLPTDLLALVGRVNGIHLWADMDRGRSYCGLAPIEEWNLARKILGADSSVLADRYIAISYHADSAHFVALDTASHLYFELDHDELDSRKTIARNVEGLFDYFWTTRVEPPV